MGTRLQPGESPEAFAARCAALLTPLIVRTIRPAVVMAGGLALAAVGFGLLTQLEVGSGLAVVVTGSVVFSLGLAPVFTLATDLIVGAAPPERAGAAAAISETSSEFGGALGIAVLGSIGTAAYRSQIADTVPLAVPPDAAAVAQDTLGGAVAVVGQFPGQLGAELLDAAREAFTQGLQWTFALSSALAVASAILAAVLLPRVQASSAPEGQREPSPEAGCCAGEVGVVKASTAALPEAGEGP